MIQKIDKTLVFKSSALDLIKFIESAKLKNGHNEQELNRIATNGVKDSGGVESLKQDIIKGLNFSTTKIDGISNLNKEITQNFVTKKRLKLSSDDGDFEYSRRYDDKPFVLMTKSKRLVRTLKLRVNVSFPFYVKNSEIEKFGIFVWNLLREIESAGIQVTLSIFYGGANVIQKNSPNVLVESTIKTAGEYTSLPGIASCLTAKYYRSAMLAMLPIMADYLGHSVKDGLGNCIPQTNPIEVSNGEVTISIESHTMDLTKLIEALKKGIN